MKKFLIWICMITCIFGLTACGSEEVLTKLEQDKLTNAQYLATMNVLPLLDSFMDESSDGIFDGYTMDEVAYQATMLQTQLQQTQMMAGINIANLQFEADGYAFYTAVESFQSAYKSTGRLQEISNTTAKIDGDQIIVEVEVIGEKKNATAEIIFSNDMFFVLESAALNPESTMGELMTGAALNTLIGMCTVFSVLILISVIISCFKVIPALQKKAAEKKANKKEDSQSAKVESPAVQTVTQEESAGDDLELAAVIAAAIAAYEGSASADGFVVRSIRRRW